MIPMTAAQRGRHLKSTTLKANGQIFAEWNLNRVSGGADVVNHLLAEQLEDDYYSIKSVSLADRPPAGIVKAMTSGSIPGAGETSSLTKDLIGGTTAYVASESDQYKYWLSPNRSGTSASGIGGYALPNSAVRLNYFEAMPVNKIVIGFETGISTPKKITLSYRAGGAWNSFSINNPVVDGDGRVVLWRQANGNFTQAYNVSTNTIAIDGISLVVNEVSHPNSFAAVIELSPRLVVDITDYVVDLSYDAEMSDASRVAPIGVSSSNVGSLTLDNSDRYFSNDNPESPFYKMIGRGIEISAYVYPTNVDETPTANDRVVIFEKMVTEAPSRSDGSVDLPLKDPSRVLQARKPNSILIQNCSVTEAMIRICHAVGFNDIEYDTSDINPEDKYSIVPFFWTDDEATAWENLSRLAAATQTAVYFDEYGKLQIQTRRTAYNLSKPVSWALDADDVTAQEVADNFRPADETGKKADIIDFSFSEPETPNVVDVNYYETNPGKVVRGIPEMVVAWEPESSVVLRSARIVSALTTASTTVQLHAADAVTWPHAGMLQVNGEVIEYDAKMYSYYLANGSKSTSWVESQEQQEGLDAKNPGLSWANSFTGLLRVSKRGAMFTEPMNHPITLDSYLVRRRVGTGAVVTMPSLFARNSSDGYATLASASTLATAQVVARKNVNIEGNRRVAGTTLRFPATGAPYGCAGVAVGLGSNDSGIYVELAKTTATGDRTAFNELNIYWKSTTGAITRYGGKGVALNVAAGVNYDMDVHVSTEAGSHVVSVFINGESKMYVQIPQAQSITTLAKVNALFFRGQGSVQFEHFYNIGVPAPSPFLDYDNPSFYDIVRGGYRSMGQSISAKWNPLLTKGVAAWVEPASWSRLRKMHYQNLFIDEFGLIAHEVREFDITYEEKPMLHSSLYLSNTSQVACTEFTYTPFGAKFVLVNTSRLNAVVNGEDTITFGADNPVEWKVMVFGRQVKKEESKTETIRNEISVVKNGVVELTVDNEHIQTKAHARHLADWVANSGGGEQEARVSVYANPHIQIGDLVAVTNKDEDLNYTHSRFFVVEKSVKYDGGLELDLTLRSVI